MTVPTVKVPTKVYTAVPKTGKKRPARQEPDTQAPRDEKQPGFIGRCLVIIVQDVRKKFNHRAPTNGTRETWDDWAEYFESGKKV
jgi:hypothetical protein